MRLVWKCITGVAVVGVLTLGAAAQASASLIFDSSILLSAQGFGNAPRDLTIQRTGGTTSPESGCVSVTGGFTAGPSACMGIDAAFAVEAKGVRLGVESKLVRGRHALLLQQLPRGQRLPRLSIHRAPAVGV